MFLKKVPAFFAVVLSMGLWFCLSAAPAPETSDPVATQAAAILQQNCSNAGCHGGATAYSFDVLDLRTLTEAKVIKPGKASDSELVQRLEAGAMPLGGYKGQPGVKLPDQDIQIVRAWIDAGAPNVGSAATARPGRPFVSEAAVLGAIQRDLENTQKADRQFLRYYSVANLWNSGDVDNSQLASTRGALSELVNHLSWGSSVVNPKAMGPYETLLRVDLRDYGWSTFTWARVISSYPYGTRTFSREEERIRDLSGISVPYIRADWFITNASLPGLYHDMLDLPNTVDELERRLGLDTALNIKQENARRFGLRNSGVSRNNRALERHETAYGAYWKSYDYANNRLEANIFRNPVDLDPDGGEIIFNLPNGLQAYLLVNRLGRRIDDGPVNIVRDRTNTDDPVVHNGRSCIACHFKGMNAFRDDIAATLTARVDAVFNLTRAQTLYPGQAELDTFLERDNARFKSALLRTGNEIPVSAEEEPISRVFIRHEGPLSLSQAAADLFIEDPRHLVDLIGRSPALQRLGFNQLQGDRGGIKRDTWEQGFGAMAQEVRVAILRVSENSAQTGGLRDERITVSLGVLQGRDAAGRTWGTAAGGPMEQTRLRLLFWLSQSPNLRLFASEEDLRPGAAGNRADFKLTGTISERVESRISVEVRDPSRGLTEEVAGSRDDLDLLMRQLADRIHLRITGKPLSATKSTTDSGSAR